MIKKIKNNDTVLHTWCGQEIQPSEYYTIQPTEEVRWANDDDLLIAIANSIAVVNDGTSDITVINDAINYLKGDIAKDVHVENRPVVVPTTIENIHSMQPCGCVKGYFESVDEVTPANSYVCNITLSSKSVDGLTFTYNSDCPIVPTVGNYVFQRYNSKRSWATAVDTVNHTITFELPNLDNGAGVYSRGFYTDFLIPDWKSTMFLWGLTATIIERKADGSISTSPCEDFMEMSIVDEYDLFKNDDVCMALFGVLAADATDYILGMGFEDNGEYGHYTRYYDESWVLSVNNTQVVTPDGSPGELLANLVTRVSLFTTEVEYHAYHIFLDYYMTSKDS